MNELLEKLERLSRRKRELSAKARDLLKSDEPDIEEVTSINDEIESIREQITQVERTLESLQEDEAEREAEEQAAEEARQAEIEKLAEEKARARIKSLGISRPDYTGSEGEPDEDAEMPAHMRRIEVGSRYDSMGTFELATEYYVKSRAHLVGASQRGPGERMYNALVQRAAQFVRETDMVPRLTRDGVKMVEIPAYNPREYEKEMKWRNESDVWHVGKQEVKHNDNVTPDGIKSLWQLGVKANDLVYTGQSGYGAEWVPTLMSAALWRNIRVESRVLQSLSQFDMPSNPFEHAKESTDPTFYDVGETTAENQLVIGSNMPIKDSKIATAKATFTAGKVGAITFWSEEQNEDSPVPIEPQFRDQFGLAVAHNVDYVLLNGDETTGTTGATTNISYYKGTPSSESFLAVDGIRHEPLVTTTGDSRAGGILSLSDVNATRKLMGTDGVYGAEASQLVIFCDLPTSMTFEDLDEVTTLDKYGSNATVMNGELGNIKGIPIVKSQDYGTTYSNGYIHTTGTNNTYGSFCIVNRDGVRVGWRRRPRIYVGQIPFSDAWYILALSRFDVGFYAVGMVGMSYGLSI